MSGDSQNGGGHGTAGGAARRFGLTRTYRLLVRGTNINQQTLLATDYLNHFNEIAMVLDLLPSMPEMLDEVRAWTPKSYAEHFRDSSFADRELAILAYENAPDIYRLPFDRTVSRLDSLVASGLARIERAIATEAPDHLERTVAELSEALRDLIATASAIIHGHSGTIDQSGIDSIMRA